MDITLIGKPAILGSDGAPRPVPGQQTWAVLARLLSSRQPLARRTLADEIFPDTDDPLGALRWCLASLRRATGPETLQGDPVKLNLPPGTRVDIWDIDSDSFDPDRPSEFLSGVNPTASAGFATWLTIERAHIARKLDERLRRDAIRALSAGDHRLALALAMRAAASRPFDEGAHIILVKALALSGDTAAALAHVKATERRFLDETGEPPTDALRAAARVSIAAAPEGISQAAVLQSLIRSGTAALAAGAVDAGLDCLRRAAADADRAGDAALQALALFELGFALVHSVRGFDDEGAIVLRQAVDVAQAAGHAQIAAKALRELGYVDAMAGRRPSAAQYLNEALTLAEGDDEGLAGVHGVIGFNLVDWGQPGQGLDHFQQSLDLARRSGSARREIWTLGLGAWGKLRAGDPESAQVWLLRALALCDKTGWLAFRPWPVALLAEARLASGKPGNASLVDLEQAMALSSQLGDPCWQASVARALSLLSRQAGDTGLAIRWMAHARARCCSVTDLYAGLLVEILDGQISLYRESGDHAKAAGAARDLLALAARTHADAHVDRAAALVTEYRA